MGDSIHFKGDDSSPPGATLLGPCAFAGLAALLRAYNYARDAGADYWDFALEIEELYALGMTVSDVRWLVARRFVEHGAERSVCGDPHRTFNPSTGFNFAPRTCLLLTEHGAALAAGFAARVHQHEFGKGSEPAGSNANEPLCREEDSPQGEARISPDSAVVQPRWDTARRELYFGEALVKRFRQPAPNQELILEVFDEDGWPAFIHDPLPQSPGICPKARLHDAIYRLNGHQAGAVLRFHGNGNGMGVYWEALEPAAVAAV